MTVTIDRATFDVLDQVTWDTTQDGTLRDNYTGRAMYNGSCLALIADDISELIRWLFGVVNAADGEEPEVAEQLQAMVEAITTGRTRHDNMGYKQVFYWSDVKVTSRS